MASYVSLINETNVFGNVNATSIAFNGVTDFTDASPIIGLVDDETLEVATNPITTKELNIIRIKDNGVSDSKIFDVDGNKLFNNSVSNNKILSLNGNKIVDGSIDDIKIINLDGSKINNNSISDSKIISLDGSKLIDSTVTNGKLVTVDGSKLVDNTVSNTKVISLDGSKLIDGTVTDSKLVTVNGSRLIDNTVSSAKVISLDGSKLVDSTVTDAKLVTVNGSRLVDATVTDAKLLTINGAKLVDDTVSNSKIVSLDGAKLTDNTVTSSKLVSVDGAKLVNSTVTDSKLITVDGSKLVDATVTDAKLVAVNGSKLVDNTVTSAKVVSLDGSKVTGSLNVTSVTAQTGTFGVLTSNTYGDESTNIFIGDSTGKYFNNAGTSRSVVIGRRTVGNFTYQLLNSVLIGHNVMNSFTGSSNVDGNIAIGQFVGNGLTSGTGNIIIGRSAQGTTDISNSIVIGSGNSTTNGEIILGNASSILLRATTDNTCDLGTIGCRYKTLFCSTINSTSNIIMQNNGNNKLTITSTGLNVTGDVNVSNNLNVTNQITTPILTNSSQLQIYADVGGVYIGSNDKVQLYTLSCDILANTFKLRNQFFPVDPTGLELEMVQTGGIRIANKLSIANTLNRNYPLHVSQNGACRMLLENRVGSAGQECSLDSATYNFSSIPAARILFTDSNYSNSISFQNKTPGADANPLVTRMWIGIDGRVGIGTTSPGQLLTVNTSTPSKIGAGGWTAISDIRMKENIEDYNKGLSEILQLRPVTFNYKLNTGYPEEECVKKQHGFIAQEVIGVFPECIIQSNNETIPDLMVLDPNAMNIALFNAIKQLNEKIVNLEQKIAILEQRS